MDCIRVVTFELLQIVPILVFDGARLPMKQGTEECRRAYDLFAIDCDWIMLTDRLVLPSAREQNMAKGKIFLSEGNVVRFGCWLGVSLRALLQAAATKCFQKAVNITPLHAHALIEVLRPPSRNPASASRRGSAALEGAQG